MTDTPPRALDLQPLLAALGSARAAGDLARTALGIAHDSRRVRRGTVFVALRGQHADGHDFLASAVAAGACAVVVDDVYAREHAPVEGAATIVVANTRNALSRLAATFYGNPSKRMRVAGVTGTNGKTTTTHLIAALANAGGVPCGVVGTLGASFGESGWPLDNTTPLALELQSLLAAMHERGAEAVAMEVSSHALALERVADVTFALAVLTNVTRDHLDFHETLESYAAAKRSLFERNSEAVFNVDDPYGRRWSTELARTGRDIVTYGFAADAQVRADSVETRADGSRFTVDGSRFTLPLPGRFNVQNALAALCVARYLGVADATSAAAFAHVAGVPGRMEHFAQDDLHVLVDYAHTPDALDAVLRAARETARGQLAVVFGCGGDRDRGKRPEMGRIASELADRVIVTSDNPRSEEPRAIVDEILAGITRRGSVVVELDRGAAIRRAIAESSAGDVVVVAGKGHERYQIIGSSELRFDDRAEVRAALEARLKERAR